MNLETGLGKKRKRMKKWKKGKKVKRLKMRKHEFRDWVGEEEKKREEGNETINIKKRVN